MPAESESPPPAPAPFVEATDGVMRWILLRRGLMWLESTSGWALLGMVLGLLVAWWWIPVSALGMVVLALMSWLGVGVWRVWQTRPSPYAAWALWDEAAGRREDFAGAWWMEVEAVASSGRERHLEEQRPRLLEALPRLRKELPLPGVKRFPAVMLGLLALGLSLGALAPPPEPVLDDDRLEVADALAEELEDLAKQLDSEDWSAEEQAALQQTLEEAAQSLDEAEGKTLRELMAALEAQAGEIERQASDGGRGGASWASSTLIEALREEVDTADLGDAVKAGAAELAAAAADSLASKMSRETDDEEVTTRLQDGFDRIAEAATGEDAERLVGGPVLEAQDQLSQGQMLGAAETMEQLAEALRNEARRERGRNQMERLAQQLRDAGSRVAQGTEAMDGDASGLAQGEGAQGNEAGGAGEGADPQAAPQVPQATAPPPGLAQAPAGMEGGSSPMSGEMSQTPMGQPPPGFEGSQGGEGAPRLMAPVPGEEGSQPPQQMVAGNGGGGEPQGSFLMRSNSLNPGSGIAELNAEATEALESDQSAVVEAADSGEGRSTVREVDGEGLRDEQARRQRTQTAVEFLSVEEAALDEATLPALRRDQVRRYFNELRRRFEAE